MACEITQLHPAFLWKSDVILIILIPRLILHPLVYFRMA